MALTFRRVVVVTVSGALVMFVALLAVGDRVVARELARSLDHDAGAAFRQLASRLADESAQASHIDLVESLRDFVESEDLLGVVVFGSDLEAEAAVPIRIEAEPRLTTWPGANAGPLEVVVAGVPGEARFAPLLTGSPGAVGACIVFDLREMRAAQNRYRTVVGATGAVALACVLLLSVVGGRSAVGAIVELRETVSRLGRGELDARHTERGPREIRHLAGDALLCTVAATLRARTRITDQVVRWGGDEFCILVPHTTVDRAIAAASSLVEVVREAIRGLPQTTGLSGLGASAGVACFPDDGEDGAELIARADSALYMVKERGRGRVLRAPTN